MSWTPESYRIALFWLVCQIRRGVCIRFPFRERKRARGTEHRNAADHRTRTGRLGMVAQLVGREAAQRLFRKIEVFNRPVDTTGHK